MREKQRKLLLELRSMLVGAIHQQPYLIYDDNTIEELLKAQPKSIEELSRVKGFPPTGKRIKGFGQAVVNVFTKPEKITGFSVSEGSKSPRLDTKVKELKAF